MHECTCSFLKLKSTNCAATHTAQLWETSLTFFFWGTAYLCPSVIPLLIWLLLFIVSHAISALHLAFAFERLFCVLPQSLTSVCVCVCELASFFFLRRCLFVFFFFSKHAIQLQTVPGKRSKLGRCTYLRLERGCPPLGQRTAEHFCHPLIYSVVSSSKSSCIPPLAHSLPSMTIISSSIVPPSPPFINDYKVQSSKKQDWEQLFLRLEIRLFQYKCFSFCRQTSLLYGMFKVGF